MIDLSRGKWSDARQSRVNGQALDNFKSQHFLTNFNSPNWNSFVIWKRTDSFVVLRLCRFRPEWETNKIFVSDILTECLEFEKCSFLIIMKIIRKGDIPLWFQDETR